MAFTALLNHLAFVCALIAVAALATAAMVRVRILDVPNDRSSHEKPIPNSGGIAIVLTVFVGFAIVYVLSDQVRIAESYMIGLGLAAAAIVFVSFLDDLEYLRTFKLKLLTQVLAACVLLGFDIVIRAVTLPFVGSVELGWWGYPVTLLWVVGFTNIFNFMDGLNGLAAGTGAIAAAFFGLITYVEGSLFVYILSYVLLAATLGFLPFNFPRARIFMGDVGSQFLGFMFAAIAVIAAEYDASRTSLLIIPLLFFHFIFDTIYTFFRRLMAGEDVTQAHRSHLYQLLNRVGWSHLKVSLLHYLMSILQGGGALIMLTMTAAERALIIVPFLCFEIVFMIWVTGAARRHGLL